MMITLAAQVSLSSPLHIGGETRLNTDATRPMLKDTNGFPYIPATSLKGKLRHEVEKLFKAALPQVYICTAPSPEQMCQPLDGASFCPVCTLFGAPWRESALRFSDLTMQTLGSARPHRTQTRVGIRIGRKRKIVEEDFLFDTELYEPGIPWQFLGTITYTGNNIADLAPVLIAARAITAMGSSRSRGLGWCQLDLLPPQQVDLAALWNEWNQRYA